MVKRRDVVFVIDGNYDQRGTIAVTDEETIMDETHHPVFEQAKERTPIARKDYDHILDYIHALEEENEDLRKLLR